MSSGYYNEHTEKEYIIFSQLLKTIDRANKMLKKIKKAPYFDYQEIQYVTKYQYDFKDLFPLWGNGFYDGYREDENKGKSLSLKKDDDFNLGGWKK